MKNELLSLFLKSGMVPDILLRTLTLYCCNVTEKQPEQLSVAKDLTHVLFVFSIVPSPLFDIVM